MPSHQGKFFSYLRVSTDQQGKSGLGIEAQRKAVLDYLDGGKWQLLGEFVEIESGKRSDRPELAQAIAACRKHKARLVIARLDRLSRDVEFIAGLIKQVDFVCCDRPHAKPFELHIYAALAQEERRLSSERTKVGLAAARARGVRLGNPELAHANRASARARAEALRPLVVELKAYGLSIRAITDELNNRRIATPRGSRWHPTGVARLLSRLS